MNDKEVWARMTMATFDAMQKARGRERAAIVCARFMPIQEAFAHVWRTRPLFVRTLQTKMQEFEETAARRGWAEEAAQIHRFRNAHARDSLPARL